MGRCNDRDAGIHAGQYGLHLFLCSQLVKDHHIRRETAYRLLDARSLRAVQQHITVRQASLRGQFTAFIHHHCAVPPSQPPTGQLTRQIPQ